MGVSLPDTDDTGRRAPRSAAPGGMVLKMTEPLAGMRFDLLIGLAILERTPGVADALLSNLPVEWTTGNEGGETWSPFDVVGHLIDGEMTDWMPRVRIILEQGARRRFDPVDRFVHIARNKGRSLNDLLVEFRAAPNEESQRAARAGPDRGAAPAHGRASRVRQRHPRAAAGDVGGARPWSPGADHPCHGEAVSRGGRAVGGLFAGAAPVMCETLRPRLSSKWTRSKSRVSC